MELLVVSCVLCVLHLGSGVPLERTKRQVAPATTADPAVFTDPYYVDVYENEGFATVTIYRQGGDLSETLSVSYVTQDSTATAPGDYTTTSGTIVFDPNVDVVSVSIPIVDDLVAENDEEFYFRITDVVTQGGVSVPQSASDAEALVTILDDDGVMGQGLDAMGQGVDPVPTDPAFV